jgi:predicted transcriptional regulator
MNISISKAAEDFKISRQTIYKYIRNGMLSQNSDKSIDVSEMIRVFENVNKVVTNRKEKTKGKSEIETLQMQIDTLTKQLDDYRQQIQDTKQREEHYRQKEQWYMTQLEQQKRIEHRPKGLLSKLFG